MSDVPGTGREDDQKQDRRTQACEEGDVSDRARAGDLSDRATWRRNIISNTDDRRGKQMNMRLWNSLSNINSLTKSRNRVHFLQVGTCSSVSQMDSWASPCILLRKNVRICTIEASVSQRWPGMIHPNVVVFNFINFSVGCIEASLMTEKANVGVAVFVADNTSIATVLLYACSLVRCYSLIRSLSFDIQRKHRQ